MAIKWNKEAVKNLGYATTAGAAAGGAVFATSVPSMIGGLVGGAVLGGVGGMVDNARTAAKNRKHAALSKQFKDQG